MNTNLEAIRGLCDALEWLLVPWGRRHRGVVRVSYGPLLDARVFTNKGTDPGALWADDAPEAEIRVDVLRDGAPWYGLCGDLKWGHSPQGGMARRLLRAIEAHGWAVQSIDGDGVLVARIGGHDVR